MFENILLEPTQKELLVILVEAARNVQRDRRSEFVFSESIGGTEISHPGLPNGLLEVYKGDVEILLRQGFVHPLRRKPSMLSFEITPEGFAYYKEIKQQVSEPTQKIELSIKSFLNADQFQRKYPIAYQKWIQAESALWSSESENQFTTIGHLCREALQEFASALVTQYQLPNDEKEKALTVKRLKAVLNLRASKFGEREKDFLDALLAYWGVVSDLIQRQEHGGQKEGEPLIWEDGRRVVFQTAIVMFEVDKSLSRNS